MILKPLLKINYYAYLCALTFGISILIPSTFSAQITKGNRNTKSESIDEGNFTTFSSPVATATVEQWEQYNDKVSKFHPEFGFRATGAPEQNVVEVLSKRTANERFFINPERPSEFYQQTSYGPIHYMVNGDWLSINSDLLPQSNGIYEASKQPEPVGFEIEQKRSYIKTVNGTASFNNWKLYGVKDGVEQLLAQADWTNYTAGDDGVYVTNVFPGIDLRMRVLQAAIKSDFIVNSVEFDNIDYLLFEDTFSSSDGQSSLVQTNDSPTEFVASNGNSLLSIGDAVIYAEGAPKEEMILTDYKLEQNKLGIAVSYNWLVEKMASGKVIIDPLVTSPPASLNQAAITGSMYNASCDFTNSCDYFLNVTPPANATITDATTNFNYLAAGACWLEDGATRFSAGSCVSPDQAGFYWFCQGIGGGTCNGNNIPIGGDLSSCLPPPACAAQVVPLQFTLQFYRTCYGNTGCTSGCISAGSAWSVTIQGRTLEYSSTNPTQQITLSAVSVCQGGSVTATSVGIQNGVPPYSVNWSLSNTGSPSIGTANSIPVTLTNIGTNTIYCFVTDACGNTVSASRTVTVTNPPAGPAVTTPVNYCIGANAVPLTSPGNGLQWYTAATGGTATAAPTPSTSAVGSTSYWVSQMVGACESQRSQINVVVHALPVISGTPVITASECAGATGAITGLTTNAPAPITYTWLNSSSAVLSTSTTSSDLNTQPAGDYTLAITDGNGCQSSQSGFIIPNQNGPNPPVVNSPVNYCQNQTASALTATGTSLRWYTQPTLTSGTALAPMPATVTPGTTTYYVTQTVNGCESLPATIDVIVATTPAAPIVDSPLTYCQNSTAAAMSVSGSGHLWYDGLSGGTGSPATPVINTSTGGTQLFYVSQNVNGCESQRATITVDIIPLAVITGNPSITPSNCNQPTGSIFGLFVSAGSMTLTTFSWANQSGTVVGNALSLSNQLAGNYFITVMDEYQCSSTYGPYTIPAINPPAAPQAQSPIEYCMDDVAVPLVATGNTLLWYTAATGGTGSSTSPTPSTALVGTTSYFVSQSNEGCEGPRKEVVVNIVDSPGAEFAVTTNIGCDPFCLTFQNLSTPTAAAIVDYEWKANGEVFSEDQTPQHCFNVGTYDIELSITDAIGCSKSITKNDLITVVPSPVAGFDASRTEAPEEDPRIEFSTINPRPAETVVWSFGDGTTDTSFVANHYFPEAGRYCVTQTVNSPYGCSDQTELCILIISDFYLFIPNAFTPTGDGINDVWKPSIRGKFTSYELSIFNRWGERVFFTDDIDTPWVGDVANGEYFFAPDGMYHFLIVIEDEEKMPKEYRGHIQLLR